MGAAITKTDADNMYTTYVDPLYASLLALSSDADNASVFIQRAPMFDAIDAAAAQVKSLNDRLDTLDAADVSAWKADAAVAQNQLNTLANEFAVYTHKANQMALFSGALAVASGSLAAWLVYRQKKAKKWAVFAGAGVGAASGFSLWYFGTPKLA